MDSVGSELISDLKQRSIQANYEFAGADIQSANQKLNEVSRTQNFDAMLLIFQSDTIIEERKEKVNYTPIPGSGINRGSNRTSSYVVYYQKFKLRFF